MMEAEDATAVVFFCLQNCGKLSKKEKAKQKQRKHLQLRWPSDIERLSLEL